MQQRLRHTIYLLLSVFIAVHVFSCNKGDKQQAIARAYDQFLYPSDLQKVYAEGQSHDDSMTAQKTFIREWIRNAVLAHKAEANLSDADKDVQRLLNEYRNALLIHRFQEKLANERLDTFFTDRELKSYFDQNKDNFELPRNIVQLSFVKVDAKSSIVSKMRALMRQEGSGAKAKLAALCSKHASNSFLDDDAWLDLNEVKKELPIQSYNDAHFLQNNKFVEIREGGYVYLVKIKNFRTSTATSSFELEKGKIKAILLRQRKLKLLKEMETDVMKEAEVNNDVELFVN